MAFFSTLGYGHRPSVLGSMSVRISNNLQVNIVNSPPEIGPRHLPRVWKIYRIPCQKKDRRCGNTLQSNVT